MSACVAHGLTKRFGNTLAVDRASIDVPRGAVYGLLGPDGAGKSTLIRMLVTVLRPDDGDALVFGESVRSAPARVTPRIGYMSQQFSMYPDLTVAQNIDFFATMRGVPRAQRRERGARLLESMALAEFADRQAGRLSGGMKQKLMLAMTLMHSPYLLLLDEPTTGVDPVSRREFWRILADLRRDGTTVLVATPYMDEAQRCTDIAFMDGGRIRHEGTPAQIAALVPGTLLEVSVAADDRRAAREALAAAPRITGAHLHGAVVRALARADEPAAAERDVRDALAGAGLPAEAVTPVAVDMEAAFAVLAERAHDREPTS